MPRSGGKQSMEVKRFDIARGATRQVRAVAHRSGFVAVSMEPAPGAGVAEAWSVGFAYLFSHPSNGTHFVSIMTHFAQDLDGLAGAPRTLSISAEGVLAVPVHTAGVQMFALAVPVEQFQPARASPWHHLDNIGLCTFAKWIGPVNGARALVTMTSEPFSTDLDICVYGKLGEARPISNHILRAPIESIVCFDAAEPGHVAFVVKRGGGFFLYVLVLQANGSFGQRVLDLAQPGLRGNDVPPNLIPVSLAVGDEQVAIGFSPANVQTLRPLWKPPGLVEAYCVASGELRLRRLLPNSLPTAVATSGSRLLVGASSEASGWQGGIYAMSNKGSGNYAVCHGDEWNRFWLSGSLHLDKLSFCYACTKVAGAETVTTVEYASVPVRAR